MVTNTTLHRALQCLVCGLALLLVSPAPALAEDGDDTELSAADKKKARRLLKRAKSHKKAADRLAKRKSKKNKRRAKARYHKAAVAYRDAYQLLKVSSLLIELAEVYQARGEQLYALRTYKKYVELEPEGPAVDDAQGAIAEIETELAEAKLAGEEPEPGDAEIDPTDFLGPEPEPEPEKIEEPEKTEEPDKTGDPDKDGDPDTVQLTAPPPRKPGRLFKWSGLGAAVIGAGLLGTGIGFGVNAQSAANELSGNDDAWNADDIALIDKGNSSNGKMLLFTSLGAAFIVGGGALFYLGMRADKNAGKSGKEKARAAFLTPSLTQDGATVTVTGWF